MLWKGRRQSENIEDRRGEGGGFGGGDPFGQGGGFRIPIGRTGGGSVSGIIILIILFFVLRFLGIDPMQIIGENGPMGNGGAITQQSGTQANDEMKQFVATVLAETEDTWSGIFQSQGMTYTDPTLVLFSGATQGACGMAQKAMGPFYCPRDHKVYIDLKFFNLMKERFHAAGDFAQAYVIAHEVGHHVQTLLGISEQLEARRSRSSRAEGNALSVRLELQADCFAGVWAKRSNDAKSFLDPGDFESALNAAAAIGDDTLQRETQGQVVPDSFTHGSSAQRVRWLKRGFETGDVQACDTFKAAQL
jgi:predicted metalloprotease